MLTRHKLQKLQHIKQIFVHVLIDGELLFSATKRNLKNSFRICLAILCYIINFFINSAL